jgi:hypothetical protein
VLPVESYDKLSYLDTVLTVICSHYLSTTSILQTCIIHAAHARAVFSTAGGKIQYYHKRSYMMMS